MVNGEDLAQSIVKVGEASRQAGLSFHQLNGITTGLVDATGITGDEAGNAIKALISKTYALGRDGGDGKAQKYLKSITDIDVRNAEGNYKSFGQILEEVHNKWNGLTNAQKINLSQAMGGTEHYSQFQTIMEQYNTVIKATNTSINSENSALNENQKYLQSTEGKLNQLKVAGEKLASDFLNSDTTKGFIDFAKDIVNGLDSIVKTIGSIPTVITFATSVLMAFRKELQLVSTGGTNGLVTWSKGAENFKKSFESNLRAIRGNNDGLTKTQKVLGIAKAGMQAFTTSTIAQTIASTALNAVIGMGVGLFISLAVEGIMKVVNAQKDLAESNQQLRDSVSDNISNNNANIQSLQDIKKEYEDLKDKASLSADEQKRYNEICEKIAGINKEATLSYDEHGKAVLSMKGNIDDLIKSLKEKNELENLRLENNGENDFKEYKNSLNKDKANSMENAWYKSYTGKDINNIDEEADLQSRLAKLEEKRKKAINNKQDDSDIKKQIDEVNAQLDSYRAKVKQTQLEQNESFEKVKPSLTAILKDGREYSRIFNEMDESTKKVITDTDILKDIYKKSDSYDEAVKKYKDFISSIKNSDAYKQAKTNMDELSEAQKNTVNKLMSGVNVDDFYKANKMDEYYQIMAKIQGMAKDGVPSLEEFRNTLITAFPELAGKFSSDEWKKLFNSIKNGAMDASTSIEDLADSISKLQKELDTNLGKAENYGKMLSEIQKTGHLSASSKKMILTKNEYKDLLPFLTKDMNTFASELQKRISDIKDESTTAFSAVSVKQEQESLQELLDTYDKFASRGSLGIQEQTQLNKTVEGLANRIEGLNVQTDANGKKTIDNIGVAKERIKTLTAEQTYLGLVSKIGQKQAEQEMRNEDAKTKNLIKNTEDRLKAEKAEYAVKKAKVNDAYANAKTPEQKAEAKRLAESANEIFNAIVQGETELDSLKEKQGQEVDINKVLEKGNNDLANAGTELGTVMEELIHNTNELTEAKRAEAQAIKEAKDAMKDYENQLKSLDNLLQAQQNYADTLAKGSQERRDALKEEINLLKQEQGVLKDGSLSANGYANGLANRVGSSDNSALGQLIVNEAEKYLGTPYAWSGESTKGFDCSGLVQYVYKQLNMEIGRTTYDQVKEGVSVDKKNLQPGDLVFFGSPSDPHHVGIYAGAGNYIHAPKTGDIVKVSQLSDRSDYLGARRIASGSSQAINTSSASAVSSPSTTTSTSGSTLTAEALNAMLAGKLAGHGQDYINAGKKYGVDPALAVAIATLETGHGKTVEHNNPAGVMDWDNGMKTLRDFPSLQAGIDYAVYNLKKEYLDEGLTTIAQIGLKYAPVGAKNDINGTNKDWIPSVTSLYKQLTGKTVVNTYGTSTDIQSAVEDMESKALGFQSKSISNEKEIRQIIKAIFDDNILEFDNKTKDFDIKIKQLQTQNEVEKANSFVSISNLKKVRDFNKEKLDVIKQEKAFLDEQLKNKDGIYDKEMLQEISDKSKEIGTNIIEGMKVVKDGITAWIQRTMDNIESKYKGTFDMIDNELTRLNNQSTVDLGSQLALNIQKAEATKQKISEISAKVKELNDYMMQTGDTTQLDQLQNMTNSLENMNTTLTELNKNIRDSKNNISDLANTMLDKIKQVIQKTNETAKGELNNNLKLFQDAVDKEIKKLDEAKNKMNNNETNYDNIQNIVKLQQQLNALQGDDITTKAKKAEIQKQLDDANRKLRQDNNNQEIDARKNALEKAKDEYNKAIQTYSDTIDKSSTDANLNQQASTSLISGYIYDVNGNKIDLQTALTNFEDRFGQGLTVLGNKIKTELLDKLKEVKNLLNEFGTLDTTKMDVSQVVKNVYASGIDLENAKAILGIKGYNYIDTKLIDTSKVSTKPGDIVVGNSLPYAGDASSIVGSDRYATAELLQIYQNILNGQMKPTGETVFASGQNLEDAKKYLGMFGYNFEDNGQTGIVGVGNETLSSNSETDMKKLLNNYAQKMLQKYVNESLKTNRIGNVYASGMDLSNARKYLEGFGYNFIDTNDISNVTLTPKDIVVGGSGVMKGASRSLSSGANWLWGTDRNATETAISDFAKELKKRPFNMPAYSDGGDVSFTGVAMLHGTEKEPETILNYKQGTSLHKFLTNIPQLVRNVSSSVRTATITDALANSDIIRKLKDSTQIHLQNSGGDEYNFEFNVDKLQATEDEADSFAKRIINKVKKRGY